MDINYIGYSDCGSYNNGKKDKSKPVIGGFASILTKEGNNKEIIHYNVKLFKNVTNNFGELSGVLYLIDAVKKLKKDNPENNYNLTIYSDSQYVVKGTNEWLVNWKRRGWKNNEGVPTKNLNLWKLMDQYLHEDDIKFEIKWVKGHKGKHVTFEEDRNIYFQEKCDTLVTKSINQYIKNL